MFVGDNLYAGLVAAHIVQMVEGDPVRDGTDQ